MMRAPHEPIGYTMTIDALGCKYMRLFELGNLLIHLLGSYRLREKLWVQGV